MEIRIDTLRAVQTGGYRITLYCENAGCRHSAPLDLDAAINRLGPDFPSYGDEFYKALKCTKCGGRRVSAILTAPGGWDGRGGHSG